MIKDKVVIITGASSGIGEATAKLLASKGAKLVLGARRGEELKQIVEEIKADGGQAVYQELDVTDPSANEAIVELAKSEFGGVDVIFLNAGIMPNSPLSELKTDDWHQTVDVNIKGVLNGVAAVLPTFIEQKSGHVIGNSSVAGLKAYPGGAVYGGTKWFVRDFMEVLRMESAMEGTNIRTATRASSRLRSTSPRTRRSTRSPWAQPTSPGNEAEARRHADHARHRNPA